MQGNKYAMLGWLCERKALFRKLIARAKKDGERKGPVLWRAGPIPPQVYRVVIRVLHKLHPGSLLSNGEELGIERCLAAAELRAQTKAH